MKRKLRLLSLCICVLIMGSVFVGCKKNEAKVVNFLNYGENIDDKTLSEFEKKYGIKVNMDTFDDMETMYQKVSSGSVKYDVILVSDALMPRMIKQDLLKKLDKKNIPNLSQMDDVYLNLQL